MSKTNDMQFTENKKGNLFKIYIVNAFEYDNGNKETSGTWLGLPAEPEKIANALERIGLPETAEQGKYFIDDSDCQIPYIKQFINSYSTIYELSETAERLNTLDIFMMMKLAAIMDSPAKFNSLEEIREFTYNCDYYTFEPEITDHTKLGLYCIYESGMFESLPEHYKDAINPTAFGKYIAEAEHGIFTPRGYLYPSGDDWEVEDLPFFRPNSLIKGVDDRNIDTTEKFAVELVNFLQEQSEDYEYYNDNVEEAQRHIKACIRTGETSDVRQMLYGFQNEYHLPDESIRGFITRLDNFDKLKGVAKEQPSIDGKPSIKKQLEQGRAQNINAPKAPKKNNQDLEV